MSDLTSTREDMRTAEIRVREALSYHTPGSRLDALLALFHTTPAGQRDALFATLAARLVLVPPEWRETGETV